MCSCALWSPAAAASRPRPGRRRRSRSPDRATSPRRRAPTPASWHCHGWHRCRAARRATTTDTSARRRQDRRTRTGHPPAQGHRSPSPASGREVSYDVQLIAVTAVGNSLPVTATQTAQELAAPGSLAGTIGDNPGEIDITWNAITSGLPTGDAVVQYQYRTKLPSASWPTTAPLGWNNIPAANTDVVHDNRADIRHAVRRAAARRGSRRHRGHCHDGGVPQRPGDGRGKHLLRPCETSQPARNCVNDRARLHRASVEPAVRIHRRHREV